MLPSPFSRKRGGATILYETTAIGLLQDDQGAVTGVRAVARGNRPLQLHAKGGVVLASGGFEGSTEMLARYLGPRSTYLRPVFAQKLGVAR